MSDLSKYTDDELALMLKSIEKPSRDLSKFSDEELKKALEDGDKAENPQGGREKESIVETALEGFGNGVFLGYGPQIQAAAEPAIAKAVGWVTGTDLNSDLPDYVQRRDENIKRNERQAQDHPITAGVSKVAGALSTAAVPGAAAARLGMVPKAATTITKAGLSGAGGGALAGFLANPGDTEGELSGVQFGDRLQNATYGAVLGGTIGAGAQGIAKGFNVLTKPTANVAKNATEEIADAPVAINPELVDPITDRAAQVTDASGRLGFEPTRGMLTDDEVVKGLESSLSQSPAIVTKPLRNAVGAVQKGLQKAADNLTRGRTERTAQDIGDAVKDGFRNVIMTRYRPIQDAFNSVQKSTKHIPVSDKSTSAIVRNIRSFIDEDLVKGTPEADVIEGVAQKLENLKNVDQVKKLKTFVEQRMRKGPPEQKFAYQSIFGKLDRLERNTIMREAIRIARTSKEGQKIGTDLVSELHGARSGYKSLMQLLDQVGSKTGIKARTVGEFLDNMEDIPSMELGNRLFKARNLELMRTMQKEFPDQFELIRSQKLSELFENSLVKGEINPNKFLKELGKYEPEVRDILLGKKAAQVVSDMKTVVNSLPNRMGPSGTPQGMLYNSVWSPSMNLEEGLRYGVYKGILPQPETVARVANPAKWVSGALNNAPIPAANISAMIRRQNDLVPHIEGFPIYQLRDVPEYEKEFQRKQIASDKTVDSIQRAKRLNLLNKHGKLPAE